MVKSKKFLLIHLQYICIAIVIQKESSTRSFRSYKPPYDEIYHKRAID